MLELVDKLVKLELDKLEQKLELGLELCTVLVSGYDIESRLELWLWLCSSNCLALLNFISLNLELELELVLF